MSQNVKLFYGARYNASIVDKKNQTHGASLVEHSNCPQWLFEGYEMSEKVQVSYKYYWESMGGGDSFVVIQAVWKVMACQTLEVKSSHL